MFYLQIFFLQNDISVVDNGIAKKEQNDMSKMI